MPRAARLPLRALVPTILGALLLGGWAPLPPGTATDATTSGPALATPRATLDAAVTCSPDIQTSTKRAVLLVHGTGANPQDNFAWNYLPKLTARGNPWCTVTVPARGMGDLQTNVEYVVHAIRRTHALSGRKIAIIGHSQGATLPTYALRIWPDLAPRVEDLISYAGAFERGTSMANLLCALPCAKAFKQFKPGSKFLTAMAQHPLPAGPSYTAFSTRYDEIVTPQPTASHLNAPGARNYVLQDLCPVDIAEHLTIIAERPFFELSFDALDNPGPGQIARIGKVSCGFDPLVARSIQSLTTFGLGVLTAYPAEVTVTEPPLRSYWKAG